MNEQQSLCTTTCNSQSKSSCSKVILVDLTLPSKSGKSLRCYCILDEQSSSSFVHPKAIDFFGVSDQFPSQEYDLCTLSSLKTRTTGLLVSGLRMKGVTEKRSIALPTMLTNQLIKSEYKEEVASPSTVKAYKHISHYAKFFPEIDLNAEVFLLVGRNCGPAMATKCFGHRAPFVHHTSIGSVSYTHLTLPTNREV